MRYEIRTALLASIMIACFFVASCGKSEDPKKTTSKENTTLEKQTDKK